MTTLLAALRRVPRSIWALGFVSMFMDMSSEMVHALLPIFLMGTLGASASFVGLVEGVAESTAAITKVFSGWLSDRLGHRKWVAVAGYSLGTLMKPFFIIAASPLQVLGARFVERIGKGIRGAPRDALVADLVDEAHRGAAYGLRQSLDTVGAVIGPLIAIALMVVLAGNIRAVFAWAVVPAIFSVMVLIMFVRDPPRAAAKAATAEDAASRNTIQWDAFTQLGGPFWVVVALGGVVTLARFSDAFLVLRAQSVGLPIALVPAIMVVMNVVYALVSAPAGAWSDRVGPERLLLGAMVALIGADLLMALVPTVPGVMVGVVLWGVHMGMSQGVLQVMVAAVTPVALRGTGFGAFYLVSGVIVLIASVLAGQLWEHVSPAAPFLTGAGLAALSTLWLVLRRNRGESVAG